MNGRYLEHALLFAHDVDAMMERFVVVMFWFVLMIGSNPLKYGTSKPESGTY